MVGRAVLAREVANVAQGIIANRQRANMQRHYYEFQGAPRRGVKRRPAMTDSGRHKGVLTQGTFDDIMPPLERFQGRPRPVWRDNPIPRVATRKRKKADEPRNVKPRIMNRREVRQWRNERPYSRSVRRRLNDGLHERARRGSPPLRPVEMNYRLGGRRMIMGG